jgi:2-keto-3-deoxy-L-rhamnonate aldolase RhmA
MDGRELKQIWRSGVPSFGAAITSTDPAIAAMVSNIGYDWVLIEAEHCPYHLETLREILATVRARGVVPIVRVTDNSISLIKQTLDLGAEGVMVPQLRTVDEARRAAAACRYPPQGVRGFTPREASNYFKEIDHYVSTINDRVIAMLQVEHIDAVNNLDSFLAIPGVDCILIGPGDLSFSLGHPLQANHPEVQAAIARTIAACNAAGMPVGIWVDGTAEELAGWIKRGINFLLIGDDGTWIAQAGRAILQRMREITGGR